MQNIEHDMDELFRKAVDQVKLLPINSRWNEIAGKLTGNSSISSATYKIKNNRNINGAGRKVLLTAIAIIILAMFINQEEKSSLVDPVSKTGHLDKDKNIISKIPSKEKIILTTYKSGLQKKTTAGANLKYPKEIILSQDQSGFPSENQLKDPEGPAIIKGNANSSQLHT